MPMTDRLYALETITEPNPLRTVKPRPRLVPDTRAIARTTEFSPLEEDFFARAADLYQQPGDDLQEWDRLFAALKVGI
jgi:hypothetical protein